MAKPPKASDPTQDQEFQRTVQRMLATPPKPHASLPKKKKKPIRPKRVKAAK